MIAVTENNLLEGSIPASVGILDKLRIVDVGKFDTCFDISKLKCHLKQNKLNSNTNEMNIAFLSSIVSNTNLLVLL